MTLYFYGTTGQLSSDLPHLNDGIYASKRDASRGGGEYLIAD